MEKEKFAEAFEKMDRWLSRKDLSPKLKRELAGLSERLEKDSGDKEVKEEIYDRFYKDLEFGTGGLRGILGAGTNRMNLYTVRRATQGFANYLNQTYGGGKPNLAGSVDRPSAAIAYDSRILSDRFALEAASVFIANGIKVYLYPELMPTPALSYAVRYYGCQGGIMVTASHNPAEYNGYKAYNDTGCQVSLDEAAAILNHVEKVDIFDDVNLASVEWELCHEGALKDEDGNILLEIIPDTVVDLYIESVKKQRVGGSCANLEVVYTPLNGTGNKPVRRVLSEIGVGKVHVVPEQEKPDGNFPTCRYPNPEKREALRKGLELCERLKTPDLLLATDPDCDRLGIAVNISYGNPVGGPAALLRDENEKPEYELPTGNEVGILLLDYLCSEKLLPENPLTIKTIVSSDMIFDVAANYGVEVRQVLTGFKFIGDQINILEQNGEEQRFIFGFEESYGYLAGTYVRDKDAVNAAMLVCEMAAHYKRRNKNLFHRLEELYRKYGYYLDDLLEFTFMGAKGMEVMENLMERLRKETPVRIGDMRLVSKADYMESKLTYLDEEGKAMGTDTIDLPESNVFQMNFDEGNRMIVRPSGTEPKLKIYISARATTREKAEDTVKTMKKKAEEWIGLWAK
ncbi:MAG: phospho-sugar mutase [Anaerovoracaceae bacterium]|jgi:phosphoglucomutase